MLRRSHLKKKTGCEDARIEFSCRIRTATSSQRESYVERRTGTKYTVSLSFTLELLGKVRPTDIFAGLLRRSTSLLEKMSWNLPVASGINLSF